MRAWPSDSLYGVCSIPAPLCGLCQGAREQSVSHSSIMAHGVLPDVLSMPANRAGADHGHPHTPGRQAGRQAPDESLGSPEAQRLATRPPEGPTLAPRATLALAPLHCGLADGFDFFWWALGDKPRNIAVEATGGASRKNSPVGSVNRFSCDRRPTHGRARRFSQDQCG